MRRIGKWFSGVCLGAALAALFWRFGAEEEFAQPVVETAPVSRATEAAERSDSAVLAGLALEESSALERRSAVLQERLDWPRGSASGKRVRLLEAPDFAFPIRVEKHLRVDEATGETVVFEELEMAANRVVARFRPGISLEEIEARLSLVGARVLRQLGSRPVYELALADSDLDAVPRGLEQLGSSGFLEDVIEYVEPNYIVHTMVAPDDPSYLDGSLWGLSNTGQNGGTADVDIDAPEGWDIRRDASPVIVAVIDTGINYQHQDLVSNVWVNPGEIADNGIDDDGNGYIDDVHGINVITGSGDPLDDNGHGSHVAGTIGAAGDDGVGVVGVAWQARILGAKFLSSAGSGSTADAVACVDYAVEMGASVLNNSWGGGGFSQALADSIEAASEAGVVFVAAAGNAGSDNDAKPVYPANYDLPNVLSVASITRTGELSGFSNYGIESVDIAAPGSSILSCWQGETDAYKTVSGTSMATPHASGILALLYAEFGSEPMLNQINRLKFGAVLRQSLASRVDRGSVANLAASLGLTEAPFPPVLTSRLPRSLVLPVGQVAVLEAEVMSDSPVSYQWYFEDAPIDGETESRLEIVSLEAADSGIYKVVAQNEDGSTQTQARLWALEPQADLQAAADSEFVSLLSYGSATWQVYDFDSVVGETSIRSGEILDSEESNLVARLEGPGELSFSWRLSSEAFFDFGRLFVDGQPVAAAPFNGDWRRETVALEEARIYQVEWRYAKDLSASAGQDALFVDALQYVRAAESAPLIVEQPLGATVGPGASYELSVQALGEGLSYAWSFEGVDLPGENQATLLLENVDALDAGGYRALVSNAFGSAGSEVAEIEVAGVPASVAVPPQSVVATPGQDVVLSVEAAGALPISYQWFFEDEAIAGANGPELLLASVGESAEGAYRVEVSNAFMAQAVSSMEALLSLERASVGPVFVKDPQSTVLKAGEELRLSGVAEGSLPMLYQWFKDDVALVGATERTLVVPEAAAEDSGSYRLEARNGVGEARSASAEALVLTGVDEALDLDGVAWELGGGGHFFSQSVVTYDGVDALQSSAFAGGFFEVASLTATVEGPGNLAWRWKQEDSLGFGAARLFVDSNPVGILSSTADWQRQFARLGEGSHEVSIVYTYGHGAILWLDDFEVLPEPVLYASPESRVYELGDPVTLRADAFGAGTLGYQWFKGATALPGETGTELDLGTADLSDVGSYRVEVSNAFGVTASVPVEVEVVEDVGELIGDGSLILQMDPGDPWIVTPGAGGGYDLRSGSVGANGESWLEIVAEGPATLVFDWRIQDTSCCPVLVLSEDGSTVWSGRTFGPAVAEPVFSREAVSIGAGSHVFRWTYRPSSGATAALGFAVLGDISLESGPVVSRQPTPVTAIEGSPASFSIQALGISELSYQWYRGEEILAGATASSLSLTEVDSSLEGEYRCLVTDVSGASVFSQSAALTVIGGFYGAVEVEQGSFRQSGAFWLPVLDDSFVGGDALSLTVGPDDPLSTLTLDLSFESEERLAVAFRLKAVGLSGTGRVRVTESGGKSRVFWDDADWVEVVLPLGRAGNSSVSWTVGRLSVGSLEPIQVWLDSIRVLRSPVAYEEPESVADYWGGVAEFDADMVGAEPMEFRWSFESEPIGDWSSESVLPGVGIGLSSLGGYALRTRNAFEESVSGVARLERLGPEFGAAVGLPGSALWTSGDGLWEVETEISRVGEASLTAKSLGPDQDSKLRWMVRGPGRVEFFWKLATPTNSDRLFLYGDGRQINGLYGSSDWVKVSVDVTDDQLHELEVRLINFDRPAESAGQGWVDGIRFFGDGVLDYGDWADVVFDGAGLSAEQVAWDGDSDGDGLANFVEYGLGLSPFAPSALPEARLVDVGDGARFEARFPARPGARDVAFGLEISQDLVEWFPLRTTRTEGPGESGFEVSLSYVVGPELVVSPLYVRLGVYYLGGAE